MNVGLEETGDDEEDYYMPGGYGGYGAYGGYGGYGGYSQYGEGLGGAADLDFWDGFGDEGLGNEYGGEDGGFNNGLF